ncbi:DUF2092 domain-containing protein [Methylocapsa acidiphila]|uniref:DUF2092 domain-containing protein n=1 Tax=Methylocapsa acidiphila TaxID=133552 RepID=UPI0018DC6062|nr:DUF2092 domain-containing protein [Methylocapsa acidiphila]
MMKQLGVLLLAAALGFLGAAPCALAQKPPAVVKKHPATHEKAPADASEKKPAADVAAPVASEKPAPAPSDPDHPAIEPAALALLKASSERLAQAKSLSFVARGAFDVPARNGQPLFYLTRSEVLLVRPNKLRVIVPGDGPPTEFYFDGKEAAVFTPYADLIASAQVPGTLDQALEALYQKAGVYFPFVDFIVSDPYKALTDGLTSAFVIGQSKLVGDTTTDIVSISDPQVHLQIWIGTEDKLPRLIWATSADGPDKPRHSIEFSDWKLDGEDAEDAEFAPRTTASTRRIPFARPDAAQSAKP